MCPSFFVFLFPLLFPLASGCQSNALNAMPDPIATAVPFVRPVPLARLMDSLHLDAKTIRFHVDKSERKFEVYADDILLKTFPCVLGEHPVGDKRMQGDRRTPEGTFTFRSKRRPHQWHVFIWIDYPNNESRRRFAERKRSGEIPTSADIGGEVGIHGVPEGKDGWITSEQDWTWGCIALKNADVDEIYPYITPWKTRLVIDP